jgi:hypothetical protein
MGRGFYSQCHNGLQVPFDGSDYYTNCMYDTENLNPLPPGYSSTYIEFKMSGSCFFESSWVMEGYAFPGSTPGRYNIMLGLCSAAVTLQAGAPWQVQSLSSSDIGQYTAYLWTIPSIMALTLNSFNRCGDQYCIGWSIIPNSTPKEVDLTATSAPFSLIIPADGTDYHGPPKLKEISAPFSKQ